MKKIYKFLLVLCVALVSVLSTVQAVSVSKTEKYMEGVRFYELRAAEDAPTGVSDAGTESINGATGTVSIVRDEITLPQQGDWEYTIRRRFNFGEYDRGLNITGMRSLSSPLFEHRSEKYLYKYLTADGQTVFVAYDTPQQMMQTENGTGTISVVAAYADHMTKIATVYDIDDEISVKYNLKDAENTGVAMGSSYLYAPENLGNDVVLTRDKTCDVSEVRIGSVGANIFTRTLEDVPVWEYDMPTLTYIPQYIRDGVVGETPNDWSVGLGAYDLEAEVPGSATFRDRGEFYDPETGMILYFIVDYLVTQGETRKELEVYDSYAYTYVETGTQDNPKYRLRQTDMYYVYAEQVNFSTTLHIYIERYDGKQFHFTVEGELTSAMAYIDQTNSDGEYRAALNEVIDAKGNTISFSKDTTEETVFTDTYGRKVVMNESGISVNGQQLVTYTTNECNDAAFDPNELFEVDNEYVCSVQNHVTGTGATYYIRPTYAAQVLGEADEYDNPHKLTVAAKTYLLTDIELITGASIHYEYTQFTEPQYNAAARTDITRMGERLVKKYMLERPDSTQKVSETNYAYDATDTSARKCIITCADNENYKHTQTFDAYGYPSNDEQESTQTGNSYYIVSATTYTPYGEGGRLLTEQTVTTKASAASAEANIVASTYTTMMTISSHRKRATA